MCNSRTQIMYEYSCCTHVPPRATGVPPRATGVDVPVCLRLMEGMRSNETITMQTNARNRSYEYCRRCISLSQEGASQKLLLHEYRCCKRLPFQGEISGPCRVSPVSSTPSGRCRALGSFSVVTPRQLSSILSSIWAGLQKHDMWCVGRDTEDKETAEPNQTKPDHTSTKPAGRHQGERLGLILLLLER